MNKKMKQTAHDIISGFHPTDAWMQRERPIIDYFYHRGAGAAMTTRLVPLEDAAGSRVYGTDEDVEYSERYTGVLSRANARVLTLQNLIL